MRNLYDDVFIYVKEANQIVRIAEGTGANLLDEDMDEGYVDYIYYDQYELSTQMDNVDGGQIMMTELFRDKYKSTEECIPEVLEFAFGSAKMDYIILN